MTIRRITRDRRLTPEEAAKYKEIRDQVAQELPDLIARHHERMAALDQLQHVLQELKAAREQKGLRVCSESGGGVWVRSSAFRNGLSAWPT
jgi:hypothetical protein